MVGTMYEHVVYLLGMTILWPEMTGRTVARNGGKQPSLRISDKYRMPGDPTKCLCRIYRSAYVELVRRLVEIGDFYMGIVQKERPVTPRQLGFTAYHKST